MPKISLEGHINNLIMVVASRLLEQDVSAMGMGGRLDFQCISPSPFFVWNFVPYNLTIGKWLNSRYIY